MPSIVLGYHRVGPRAEEGRWLNVEPARLDSHVRFLLRRGRPFQRADELFPVSEQPSVCLTFDDAYASAVAAREVLLRNGVRATYYAVPGCTSSVWDGELARPLATPDDLVALSREGFEVGNHTFSHPRLGILSWVEVVRQLAEADRHLRELGLAPATLCLPYGSESAVATEWAMATGYRAVLTLRKGVLTRNDQAMAVPRVLISYGDSLPMFFYKVFIRAPRRRLVYSGVPGL